MSEPTPPPIQDFRPASPVIPLRPPTQSRRATRKPTMADKFSRLAWPKQLMVVATALWAGVISVLSLYVAVQFIPIGVEGTVMVAPLMFAALMVWIGIVSVPYGVVMVIALVANSVLPPSR